MTWSGTLVAVIALATALTMTQCSHRSAIIEIPDGYVGWIVIHYSASTPCNESSGLLGTVIRVGDDGTGCSTVWNGVESLSMLRQFYVDARGQRIRELKSTGWGKGGEIWGDAAIPSTKQMYFFVGSQEQFRAAKKSPRVLD